MNDYPIIAAVGVQDGRQLFGHVVAVRFGYRNRMRQHQVAKPCAQAHVHYRAAQGAKRRRAGGAHREQVVELTLAGAAQQQRALRGR